ncbi:hypothetical protein PSYPI_44066, partial [Pseudomonas syringae pv. pisi str. 1704B]
AVHDRHIAIGDDQIEGICFPAIKPLRAVFGHFAVMAEKAELLAKQQSIGWMIVDDQDPEGLMSDGCRLS